MKSLFSSLTYAIINLLLNLQMQWAGLRFREAKFSRFTIRYWDSENDLPALVLLQAFTADSKFTWRKQVRKLSRQYRLIIPNLVHFGGSRANNPDYSVQEQVDALTGLLAQLKIRSICICGASYSGIIAAEIASQYPELVRKLAIIAIPVKYVTDEDREKVYKESGVKNRIELLVPDNYKMIRNLIGIAYTNPPPIPAYIFKTLFNHLYSLQKEDRKKLLSNFDREQVQYDSKNYHFAVPVLLIWGEKDRMVPLHAGKKMKEHMGENARLEIFKDCAHLPNLEKPQDFTKRFLNFLKPE